MLFSSAALLLLAGATDVLSTPAQRASSTPCAAGQSCFPSAKKLATFNATLDGHVRVQRPLAAECFVGDPAYNLTGCAEYNTNALEDQYLTDHSATYSMTNWEQCSAADRCTLDGSKSLGTKCTQGNVPAYAVEAHSASDIQKFVKFATKNNLRFSVKNTGHDYKGRSAGKDSFMLWTHLLKDMSVSETFVPRGCSIKGQPAITLGAGVQWGEAYEYADSKGKLLVGGDAAFVGTSGGWVQGGGHSFLTPNYGMGVDNLLEMKIVTPDGQLRTISECSEPDLFWAVRGGGGGTWGVATQVTYRAHPKVPIASVAGITAGVLDLSDTAKEAFVAKVAASAVNLGNAGFGGAIFWYESYLEFAGTMPNKTEDDVKKAVAPIYGANGGLPLSLDLKTLTALANLNQYTSFDSYSDFSKMYFSGNIGVGAPLALSSRLVPSKYFSDPKKLASIIGQGFKLIKQDVQPSVVIMMLGGSRGGSKFSDPSKTSINPVWTDTVWHVIFSAGWKPQATDADKQGTLSRLHAAGELLRQYVPDGGAYQNEADIYEPDPRTAFWGSNYAKLLRLKNQWDPKNLFAVWHGVGWAESGVAQGQQRFQCYSSL